MMLGGDQLGQRRQLAQGRRHEGDANNDNNHLNPAANSRGGGGGGAERMHRINNNNTRFYNRMGNTEQQQHRQHYRRSPFAWKLSHLYCLGSGILAVLAVIMSASESFSPEDTDFMPNADIGGGSIFFDTASIMSSKSSSSLDSSSSLLVSCSSESLVAPPEWSNSVETVAKAAAAAVSLGNSNENINVSSKKKEESTENEEEKGITSTITEGAKKTIGEHIASPPISTRTSSPSLLDFFLKTCHFLDAISKGFYVANNNGNERGGNGNKRITDTGNMIINNESKIWSFLANLLKIEIEADKGEQHDQSKKHDQCEQRPRAVATSTSSPKIVPSESCHSDNNLGEENNLTKESIATEVEYSSSNKNSFNASTTRTFVDPTILNPSSSTPTDIIDKILTSTPRLLAIANLLLAMTYLLHTAVAEWFLGVSFYSNQDLSMAAGRERLGGFLVFKLLLISAVVAPDTLDLLILLSWYTLLSFLRSLAHLAAATTNHTTQSGQTPPAGVLRLLILVLLSDCLAAAVCVALFHGAGWGMVLLLTSDCVLLAVDVVCHMLRHMGQVVEEIHGNTISEMEEQQLDLHNRQNRQVQRGNSARSRTDREDDESIENSNASDNSGNNSFNNESNDNFGLNSDIDENSIMATSRRLDEEIENMESKHSRYLGVLDTTVFTLQILAHVVTVCHFLHIWTLHGIQFTLIDGVLALHLQSALSSASKKIAERRNLDLIARKLNHTFVDASEMDIKKVVAAGDVCCICLGTMSVGSVKKVGCGHLFHTNCLREVVERARSMEAARCPLCRAHVVDGRSGDSSSSNNSGNNNIDESSNGNNVSGGDTINNNNERGTENLTDVQIRRNNRDGQGTNNNGVGAGERALFRFTTEGILPAWLPIPAFSFEVVRRPPASSDTTTANAIDINSSNNVNSNVAPIGNNTNNNGGNEINNDNAGAREVRSVEQQSQQLHQHILQHEQQNLLQRFLILTGALPMSPEDENRYMLQLVDMFPQYDRADLLRELRERRSVDAVAESVLSGSLAGRERGEGIIATPTNNSNNGDQSTSNEGSNINESDNIVAGDINIDVRMNL